MKKRLRHQVWVQCSANSWLRVHERGRLEIADSPSKVTKSKGICPGQRSRSPIKRLIRIHWKVCFNSSQFNPHGVFTAIAPTVLNQHSRRVCNLLVVQQTVRRHAVRPLDHAHYPYLAVRQRFLFGDREYKIWQWKQGTGHPDADRRVERSHKRHSRLQRIHDCDESRRQVEGGEKKKAN